MTKVQVYWKWNEKLQHLLSFRPFNVKNESESCILPRWFAYVNLEWLKRLQLEIREQTFWILNYTRFISLSMVQAYRVKELNFN